MSSELQVNTITEATSGSGITFAKDVIPATPLSHRNMIINGGMTVWQRGINAVVTATGGSTGYGTADRWRFEEGTGGSFTSGREALSVADQGITGQRTALELLVTATDTSLTGNEYAYFFQRLEGQDLQHLQYGSSNAKTITLSFWVKSNLTGTYCIYLRKVDNTDAYLVKEYTISAANTWEKKIITITPTEGSTTAITTSGGAIDNDTGFGLEIGWSLGFGPNYHTTKDTWQNVEDYTTAAAVNWMGASNNFYITGVQLELGSVATPFEHRSYVDELRRCQRYFVNYGINDAGGFAVSPESGVSFRHTTPGASNTITSNACFANVDLPVRMRTGSPTFTAGRAYNGSGSNLSNTNWGPFTPTGCAQQICIQKKTNDMTTNQTIIILSFSIEAEL